MYKRDELIAVKKEFWIRLGQYLAPVPSAFGLPVNWINYKSGITGIQVKLHADTHSAAVLMEIQGDDAHRQKIIKVLRTMQNNWPPDFELRDSLLDEHGQNIARFEVWLQPANIMDKDSWPAIISFLKKHIIAFDAFWSEHRDIFEMVL